MTSVLLGALGLVVLDVLLSSSSAQSRLTGAGAHAPKALARFVDPTVPLFGPAPAAAGPATSTSTTSTADQTPPTPTGPPVTGSASQGGAAVGLRGHLT